MNKIEKEKLRKKQDVLELKDWYVRKLLTKGTRLKASDIPDSLVGVKRALIMLQRAIRDKRKNQHAP